MKGEEFSTLWTVLHASWPFDFPNDQTDTKTLWASRLMHHDYRPARAAVNEWIDSHRKAPKIADVIEGIRKQSRGLPRPVEDRRCGRCDHGWEWVDQAGQGTVQRCRNGCLPPEKPDYSYDKSAVPMAPSVAAALRGTLAGLTPPKRMGVKR